MADNIARVRKNLRVKIEDIDNRRTKKALYSVLTTIKNLSDLMTPIDTSNLINSGYIEVKDSAGGMIGKVGYTASYAQAVHDAPGTLKGQPRANFGRTSNYSEYGPKQVVEFGGGTGVGDYWDPDAEPKFLEKAGDQASKYVETILKEAYKDDAG